MSSHSNKCYCMPTVCGARRRRHKPVTTVTETGLWHRVEKSPNNQRATPEPNPSGRQSGKGRRPSLQGILGQGSEGTGGEARGQAGRGSQGTGGEARGQAGRPLQGFQAQLHPQGSGDSQQRPARITPATDGKSGLSSDLYGPGESEQEVSVVQAMDATSSAWRGDSEGEGSRISRRF